MPIIYTPTTIWKNFSVSEEPTFISSGKVENGEFIYENGYVLGRSANGERVKIFVKTVKKGNGKMPAVLIINDFDIYDDDELIKKIADSGYFAVMVDIVGKIRGYKSENKISMKTQIESLDITSNNADFIASVDYDIKAVGGIQKLTTQTGESDLVFGAIVPDEQ